MLNDLVDVFRGARGCDPKTMRELVTPAMEAVHESVLKLVHDGYLAGMSS
jgi:hypothetical protein